MSPAQPQGNPAPADGEIPALSASGTGKRDFSLYVHVPFCSVRCGYCDFNTYAIEDFGNGVNLGNYANDAVAELDFAARAMLASGAKIRPMHSVFFGGGTPTRLPATDLVRILDHAIELFGLNKEAEVTTEANPDSITDKDLQTLKAGGFTRVSFGMQSVVPSVLKVLDRTHTPAKVPHVVRQAKDAGLQVSVDLIYGAPGETLEQWRKSLEAAVSYEPDHISTYSLIVEEGTKLWAQIRRGDYPMPDDDLMADMYLTADEILTAHGYSWYEVSNFARTPDQRSKHNLVYWRNQDWWGIGPGAHSHINGTRWWNLKHPVAYANRVREGLSPAVAREVLDRNTQIFEEVMLQLRIREGIPIKRLQDIHGSALANKLDWLVRQGLLDSGRIAQGRAVLTLAGRLLGDAVTRELLPDIEVSG